MRRSDKPKKIIIHADDFGIGAKTNEGIQYLFEKNILTSCSLMANGPAFDSAVSFLNQHPGYDAGIHLCLTFGKPVRHAISSLVNEHGCFHSLKTFVVRYVTGRIRLEDIHREWGAQISAVLDNGIQLSHIDSHHHIHAFPALFDLALSLCSKYHIRGIRIFNQTVSQLCKSGKSISLALLNPTKRSLDGVAAPDNIAGLNIKSSDRTNPFVPCLDERWRGVRELICHPGFYDESLMRLDAYISQRPQELAHLDSWDVANRLNMLQRITYKDIIDNG